MAMKWPGFARRFSPSRCPLPEGRSRVASSVCEPLHGTTQERALNTRCAAVFHRRADGPARRRRWHSVPVGSRCGPMRLRSVVEVVGYIGRMRFKILDEIRDPQPIANGRSLRARTRLEKVCEKVAGENETGSARVEPPSGDVRSAEIHWCRNFRCGQAGIRVRTSPRLKIAHERCRPYVRDLYRYRRIAGGARDEKNLSGTPRTRRGEREPDPCD